MTDFRLQLQDGQYSALTLIRASQGAVFLISLCLVTVKQHSDMEKMF